MHDLCILHAKISHTFHREGAIFTFIIFCGHPLCVTNINEPPVTWQLSVRVTSPVPIATPDTNLLDLNIAGPGSSVLPYFYPLVLNCGLLFQGGGGYSANHLLLIIS